MRNEKYALLVIDMQLVAFDGKITPPIIAGSQLLDKVSTLISICRVEKIPIVYIQTCAVSGQPYARDAHGWEIHPSIYPKAEDRIVYKENSSGFDGTNLPEVLLEIGVTTVITCGIWSEYCLTATSESALLLGFKVCVAANGHGTVADSEESSASVVASQNNYLIQQQAMVLTIDDIKKKLACN